MSDFSGKKGEPAPDPNDPQDDRIDEFLEAYSSTPDFGMRYRSQIFTLVEALKSDSSPATVRSLRNFLSSKGVNMTQAHWDGVVEAHTDFHFMPCKATLDALLISVVLGRAGAVISAMAEEAGGIFANEANKISQEALLSIRKARERSLEFFYRDVRKFLEGPGRSSRRDIIAFDEFVEATNRQYHELAGKNNRDLRAALKKALVGGKVEIIKNNIKKYGSPSIDGKTYGCDIRLKVDKWRGSDQAKYSAVEAIKSWQALVVPSLVKGMSQFRVTVQLGGPLTYGMPTNAAASYMPTESIVVIPHHARHKGNTKTELMSEIADRKCYIYHEMTHILGNVNPSIPFGNMGRWGDTYSLVDTSIALLADFMRDRDPGVPLNKSVKLLPSVSSLDSPVFGVRDSLVNPYAGVLYKASKDGDSSISETEALTSAVESFSSAETMLSLFMTDRELFSHALALFYGEYFNEEV